MGYMPTEVHYDARLDAGKEFTDFDVRSIGDRVHAITKNFYNPTSFLWFNF